MLQMWGRGNIELGAGGTGIRDGGSGGGDNELGAYYLVLYTSRVLQTLAHLPVSTKNQLDESKLLPVVMRWAESSNKPPLCAKGGAYRGTRTCLNWISV